MVEPVVAVRGKPSPLFRQPDLPVGTYDAIGKETVGIAADRITGARSEAEVVPPDGRDDAGNADGATPLLAYGRGRRRGIDAYLPQQTVNRDLAHRGVEHDLPGNIRKAVIVSPEARATRDLHHRFGILQPDRPLANHCRSGLAERLRPAHLRLPIEDLADGTAEIQRIGQRRRVHEVGPGLPSQEMAQRSVGVTKSEAMRITHTFIAVGAVKIEFDMRVQITHRGRRVRLHE